MAAAERVEGGERMERGSVVASAVAKRKRLRGAWLSSALDAVHYIASAGCRFIVHAIYFPAHGTLARQLERVKCSRTR